MKPLLLFILLACSILILNNCNKSSKNKFTTITVKYTTNITQSQCTDGSNSFSCIYFDIIDPGKGRVSRTAIYNLQSTGTLELEMGPTINPRYCSGSDNTCSDADRIHYQVGKTYQYKAYLVCKCSSTFQCGNDFQILGDGTSDPVKILNSGTIELEKKGEKNVIEVTLSH